jgi:NAD(P)H dehydrogenase (quinone)
MIVVSGGSGDLAGRAIRRLVDLVGPDEVQTLSRTPEKITTVAARYADFADPPSLTTALAGADRFLLVSIGGLKPEDQGRQADAVAAAVKAGVRHIVYTSFTRAGDSGNPVQIASYHGATERVLAESGVAFTALRFNIWPEAMRYIGIIPAALKHGRWVSNAGDGRVGYVDKDDCADVAAHVLANGSHQGEILEVTGPQSVTDRDFAALLGVEYTPVTDEEAVQQLAAVGITQPMAGMWAEHGIQQRAGWHDAQTDVVERITGRPAVSLRDHFMKSDQNFTDSGPL